MHSVETVLWLVSLYLSPASDQRFNPLTMAAWAARCQDHQGKWSTLYSVLSGQTAVFAKIGVLNAFSTYSIFNS